MSIATQDSDTTLSKSETYGLNFPKEYTKNLKIKQHSS